MQEHQHVPSAALLLRVLLGIMFLAHGLLKIFVFTMPGTVVFFKSLGLPGFAAYLVMIAEIGGGIALITGFYVRHVSPSIISVLLGTGTLALNDELFGKSGLATSESVQS